MVIVITIVVTTSLIGSLSFGLTYGFPGLLRGLLFGLVGLAAPIIVSDLVTEIIHRGDPILTSRRINIVSFVWCLVNGCILVVSGMLSAFTGNPELLLRGMLLAVLFSIGLRFLVYSVFSRRNFVLIAFTVVIQPLLMISVIYFLSPTFWSSHLATVVIVLVLILLGPLVLLVTLNSYSFDGGSLRIIPMFRAFVYAWAEEINDPLEEQLAKISELHDLEADALNFVDPSGNCIGKFIAPYIHPGPFRNVGSSGLSLRITEGLGKECGTLVVHGISNHEWDMARSSDVDKVVSALMSAVPSDASKTCGPMARAEVNGAKASCQLIGDTAFFTLTLSPKSHDDIPNVVKDQIRESASRLGLKAIVVDAHNCLDDEDLIEKNDVDNLVSTAKEAIEKAIGQPQGPFKVGFSMIKPSEWGLDDGMGPCGIGVAVFEVYSGERYVYVVFDSNNMIQGLREKLVKMLASEGYADSEILTSDTHLVNAIGATERGYHPMGEAMNEDKIIAYIEEALRNTVPIVAEANFTRVEVDNIKVIGFKGLEILRDVIKTSFSVFIRTTAIMLPLTLIAAALVAFFY